MKILLLNVHSALNLGDHGIMHSTLQAILERVPDAEITVAANHPESWRMSPDPIRQFEPFTVLGSFTSWVYQLDRNRWKRHVESMIRHAAVIFCAALCYRLFHLRLRWGTTEQRQLLDAYYEADVVLSCGGGNFYADRKVSPFLIWALIALTFAIALGKKVVMLPQSFGPIPGQAQQGLLRWVLNHTQTVMVREPWSKRFVRDQLHTDIPVVMQPDLAFGLAAIASAPRPARHAPQIGVTVLDRGAQLERFGGQSAYEDTLCNLLERLVMEHRAEISLFCQCYGPSADQDDRLVTARLHARLQNAGVTAVLKPDMHSAQEALNAYKEMDIMVGTRMHTAIFALCSATPVLLIGYQPKSCSVMTLLGLERYCHDIAHLDPRKLYACAVELVTNRADVQSSILAHRDELRDHAMGWTRNLV